MTPDEINRSEEKSNLQICNEALDRMKRASDRGTGCHLTAEMIEALSTSVIGSIWEGDTE